MRNAEIRRWGINVGITERMAQSVLKCFEHLERMGDEGIRGSVYVAEEAKGEGDHEANGKTR